MKQKFFFRKFIDFQKQTICLLSQSLNKIKDFTYLHMHGWVLSSSFILVFRWHIYDDYLFNEYLSLQMGRYTDDTVDIVSVNMDIAHSMLSPSS
jgi:hypothetical protein